MGRTGPVHLALVQPGRASSKRVAARRRLVLSVLVAALAVATALAFSTGAGAAWWAVVALVPFLLGYLAVFTWLRGREAEREFKMAFLPARGRLGDPFAAR